MSRDSSVTFSPFRMGCGSSLDAMYDDPMPVVVFGATGLVGGAVARALLKDKRFEVKAVTRSPTTDVARKLAEEGWKTSITLLSSSFFKTTTTHFALLKNKRFKTFKVKAVTRSPSTDVAWKLAEEGWTL